MAVVFDLESLLDKLQSILAANLNTKITAIDTEKNDGITLKQVDSNAYHFQTMNQKIAGYNPNILYGVDSSEAVAIDSLSAHVYSLKVVLILEDSGTDKFIVKRLLRYQRAIKEVIEDNYDRAFGYAKMKVKELPPDVDSVDNAKFIGILIEASLA